MSVSEVWRAVSRWFFLNFFSLLLFAVSAAQWLCLWWLLWPADASPILVHPAGILTVYFANRKITGGRFARRSARGMWHRIYDAFALTSFFCALFLILMSGLQLATHLFVGTVLAAIPGGASPDTSGVDKVFRWLTNGGAGLIALAFAYGYTFGQSQLTVTRLRLPLRGFAGLDGLRIAQISDVHIGQNLGFAQLERFVERVNEVEADIICITGDIADNAASDLARYLPVLARLRARRAVIAILGNHDHYAGANRVEEALSRYTPFIVLRDECVRLDIDGTSLNVIGLDDRGIDWARGVTETPYLAQTMGSLPADEAVLVLCHRPDIFRQSAALGVGLTLSGHTHGGQIALPWLNGKRFNLARIVTRFDRGLFRENDSFLYVNNGLGVTSQRLRLWTPREVLVVEVDSQAEVVA